MPPIVARVCSYRDDVFCKNRFVQNSPRKHYIDVSVHLPRTVLIMTWRYHLFGVYIDLVDNVSLPPRRGLTILICPLAQRSELTSFHAFAYHYEHHTSCETGEVNHRGDRSFR